MIPEQNLRSNKAVNQYVSLGQISRWMNVLVLKCSLTEHLSSLTKNLSESAVWDFIQSLPVLFWKSCLPSIAVYLPSLFVDYWCVSPVCGIRPSSVLQIFFDPVSLLSCIRFVWPLRFPSLDCFLLLVALVYDQLCISGWKISAFWALYLHPALPRGLHPPPAPHPDHYRSFSQTRLLLVLSRPDKEPWSETPVLGVINKCTGRYGSMCTVSLFPF